jgi:hypothetical protein
MKNKLQSAFYALLMVAILQACQSKPDYKTVRQEVLDVHDRIMMDSERAMNNKMKLDTLLASGIVAAKGTNPALDTAAEKQHAATLIKKLVSADDEMTDWMQKFKADIEGKSNEEAVQYFTNEKVKVQKLDSLYQALLAESGAYLRKLNTQPDTAHAGHDHGMHH